MISLRLDLITLHIYISNAVEVMRKISQDHSIDLDIPAIVFNTPVANVPEEPTIPSDKRILEDPEKLVFPDQASYQHTAAVDSDMAIKTGLSPPPYHRKGLRKSRTYNDLRGADSASSSKC
jgi:hypothetical protein